MAIVVEYGRSFIHYQDTETQHRGLERSRSKQYVQRNRLT